MHPIKVTDGERTRAGELVVAMAANDFHRRIIDLIAYRFCQIDLAGLFEGIGLISLRVVSKRHSAAN